MSELSTGQPQGFPEGWSNPGDYFVQAAGVYVSPPMVWVRDDPARAEDIVAMLAHEWGQIRGIDTGTICGKECPDYITVTDILREAGL